MEQALLHLSLELEVDSEPIKGWLQAERGERREFEGWMELAAALEVLIEGGADDARPSA